MGWACCASANRWTEGYVKGCRVATALEISLADPGLQQPRGCSTFGPWGLTAVFRMGTGITSWRRLRVRLGERSVGRRTAATCPGR